ncbi:hypothetical protein SDC9_158403 [bioreactor metagenome]|uniref:Uncharacterized protein n=1 Tax=bioreactor metagenome TaxID=1076179 RepID=A0A645FC03_9ZZZZ
MGNFTAGLLPDFRTSRPVMGIHIVRVAKLVQDQSLTFFLHLQRHITRLFHILRLDQLGAISTHGIFAFLT